MDSTFTIYPQNPKTRKDTFLNIFNIDRLKDIVSSVMPSFYATYEQPLQETLFEELPESYVKDLFLNFSFASNPNDIINYLNDFSFLIPILYEANEKIKEHFPSVGKDDLLVEMFVDPETGDKRLFLNIIVDMEPQEALSKFNELRHDWWLNVLDKTQWKMGIDVDFK